MLYVIKNKAKQPIVCSLADESTLRLAINGETKITDKQMTDHLKTLSSKNLLVIREVVEQKINNKKNSTKSVVESKEEEKNGNL